MRAVVTGKYRIDTRIVSVWTASVILVGIYVHVALFRKHVSFKNNIVACDSLAQSPRWDMLHARGPWRAATGPG